jgi:hypothetical protein
MLAGGFASVAHRPELQGVRVPHRSLNVKDALGWNYYYFRFFPPGRHPNQPASR